MSQAIPDRLVFGASSFDYEGRRFLEERDYRIYRNDEQWRFIVIVKVGCMNHVVTEFELDIECNLEEDETQYVRHHMDTYPIKDIDNFIDEITVEAEGFKHVTRYKRYMNVKGL